MKTLIVKLYMNRINFDTNPILTYVHQYYLKHGVTINFDIQPIDVKGYVSVYTQVRPGIWYWILNGAEKLVTIDSTHSGTVFMFDQQEWKTQPGSPYPLLPNVPTSSTIPINGRPFMNLGMYSPDLTGNEIMMAHEFMHFCTQIANASGLNIIDQMDTYFENSNPDAPDGNFSIQWKLLQSWLNPTNPTVTITRNSDNGTETIGTLVAQNNGATFTCNTLELPWKNNQHDISCIPSGTYICKWKSFHNTFHYELQNVQNRTGIFVHNGNFYKDSLGCIIIGAKAIDLNGDGQLDVNNSVITLNALETFLSHKDFTLTIS